MSQEKKPPQRPDLHALWSHFDGLACHGLGNNPDKLEAQALEQMIVNLADEARALCEFTMDIENKLYNARRYLKFAKSETDRISETLDNYYRHYDSHEDPQRGSGKPEG